MIKGEMGIILIKSMPILMGLSAESVPMFSSIAVLEILAVEMMKY